MTKRIRLLMNTYLFRDFICEVLEFFVQRLSTLHLRLFQLDFILVTIAVFSFPIACLVKLNVGCFAIDLNILIAKLSAMKVGMVC